MITCCQLTKRNTCRVAISPALTVVQGGSGLVGLSRAFSPYLVTRDITSSLTISDIPDLTVQMCLQEVKSCQSKLYS